MNPLQSPKKTILQNQKGFLSLMDEKYGKKWSYSTNYKKKLEKNISDKETFDKFIDIINKDFDENNFNSLKFCGWNDDEIKKYKYDKNNPNIYNTNTKNFISNQNKLHFFQLKTPVPKNIKIIKRDVTINVEINCIDDLLNLIKEFPLDDTIQYNIDMASIHKIGPLMVQLNNMIGMKDLKNNVVDQILYFIQDLHKSNGNTSGDFMHTCIYGPPGTGKTEMAKIIGQIFSQLGILKKGTFKKVTRSDLVAGYLGQTAIKTSDLIKECLGGVLFIDEAYALGNPEKRDSFSKECIDTLCEALSNHKDELMVIIAGYEKELNECFFSYNQGLDSRFTWRFKTDEYNGEELYKIFIKKVKEIGWDIEPDTKINAAWFEKNYVYFKFFGRDIETLLSKTKIAHSRRVFCKGPEDKKKLTIKDLEKGFEMYLKNEEVKNRKEISNAKYLFNTMYV
jgi:SpoVK/Ycf46/Vps4 family AAA+-type ATPase